MPDFDEDEDHLSQLRGVVLSALLDDEGSLVLFYAKGRTLTITFHPEEHDISVFPGILPEC